MLSDDSRDSRHRWRVRRWSAVIGAVVIVGGYVGCGFPKYTYDDNAFYEAGTGTGGSAGFAGSSGSGGSGAIGGSDASVGGSSGSGGATGGSGGATGGSGGATGGSGGATGGSGGATGGSGGSTGGENCTNGVDDNGNNLIDCADQGCANAGYVCQSIPSGWQGPVALYTGDAAKNPPPCDVTGSYQTAVLSRFLDPSVPAQCQCSCGAASGVTCGAPRANLYSVASCGAGTSVGLDFAAGNFNPGDCVHFTQPADAGTFTSVSANVPSPVQATGGSCAASKVQVTKPSPWKDKAVACALPSSGWKAGGCNASQVCVPPPPSGFANTCIYKTGDVACPSTGLFSTKKVVYDNSPASDTRDCTACTCGAPSGNCSGTVDLWSTATCSGNPDTSVDLAGNCKPFASTNTLYSRYTIDSAQPNVKCASGGGQPTGSVTGANPTTFCCK